MNNQRSSIVSAVTIAMIVFCTYPAVAAENKPLPKPLPSKPLKCKDVNGRWQICGSAKPFKQFTVGVGFRFSEQDRHLSANPEPSSPARRTK